MDDNNSVQIEPVDNRVIYTLFTKHPRIVIDGVEIKNLLSYYVKLGDGETVTPDRAIVSITFSTNDLEIIRNNTKYDGE